MDIRQEEARELHEILREWLSQHAHDQLVFNDDKIAPEKISAASKWELIFYLDDRICKQLY